MDNNEFVNSQPGSGTYHATSNLNTAMENPEFAVNDAMGVNIDNTSSEQNMVSNPYVDNYSSFDNGNSNIDNSFVPKQEEFNNNGNNSFISQQSVGNNVSEGNSFIPQQGVENNISESNSFVPTSSGNFEPNVDSGNSESYDYEPVMQQNKKKAFGLSREVKVVIFIAVILFLFIMFMPYIYDFFKDLQLVFTS